jgi:hypothetical protein
VKEPTERPRRFGTGTAIALFFGTLIAFNVAFYVIALLNPPAPLP